ncbi:hypothetical protein P691DRAFT_771161 [Macrolepiota fuliginosa MF-IS2]|uniref:NUC153 domain-containing protein n=1 Tax=Macrolepiota fuliginosa MF-IS2 TaxID=1400762 RepID=A0A9P5XR91_9AGAR|nr:hypothetical protein P691DRAFT_771161 [Macrolepiota fuliginosa MF-IS2]
MSDPRFTRLKTDPRFRLPKKKQQKVVVDERFKSVFEQTKDKKGKGKAGSRVDKYGRKLSKTHEEDNLRKYYRLDHGSDEEGDKEKVEEAPRAIDYARGEVLLDSSDEEEDKDEDVEESDHSSADEIVRLGSDEGELEIDLDEDAYAELDAQVAAYAKANRDLEKEEKTDTGTESRTRRLAVVNLDWDYVRASHLYKVFSSLVSLAAPYVPVSAVSAPGKGGDAKKSRRGAAPIARGVVLSVRVYPSEFGKARMEQEEKEGPPAEIFKKKQKQTEEINEKTIYEIGDEDEYDEDALRRYQLERLRYHYAIVECDTVEAASHIYNELEGTELERSANVFDLSFVPDDMTFDAEPRDEASEDVSTDYKPVDYVTDALRHSKVKLTWDDDDPERYQVTRRQLTQQEIEDADFRAYIASSSSEDEGEGNIGGVATLSKKDKGASRQKLRALLLGGNDDALPEGWSNEGDGNDVDMEITFTPGLSEQKGEDDETTLEKYQRKMREKRKQRKEERKGKAKTKEGEEGQTEGDEFFDFGSGSEGGDGAEAEGNVAKQKSQKKRGHKQPPHTTSTRKESTAEELALIAASDSVDGQGPKHFNMKAVLKAEKRKGKKEMKKKRDQGENELQEDFTIDVNDERFKVLHEDHQFAIDPTNPHFKKTKGMKALLEERQRRQKGPRSENLPSASSSQEKGTNERGLKSLVERIKRKSQEGHGTGKRRRL